MARQVGEAEKTFLKSFFRFPKYQPLLGTTLMKNYFYVLNYYFFASVFLRTSGLSATPFFKGSAKVRLFSKPPNFFDTIHEPFSGRKSTRTAKKLNLWGLAIQNIQSPVPAPAKGIVIMTSSKAIAT